MRKSVMRWLAKWRFTRQATQALVGYGCMFGIGFLACYAAMQTLSPTTMALLAGLAVGAAIAPIGWLSVAILLHDVDRERHQNDLASLAEMEHKLKQLDEKHQAVIRKTLARMNWAVAEEEDSGKGEDNG